MSKIIGLTIGVANKGRHISFKYRTLVLGKKFFFSKQQLIAPFLNLMPLLQSLIPRACKQGGRNKVLQIKKLLPRLKSVHVLQRAFTIQL